MSGFRALVLATGGLLGGVSSGLRAQAAPAAVTCRAQVAEWLSQGCAAVRIRSEGGQWEEAITTYWHVQLAESRERPRMEREYVGKLERADETIMLDRMFPVDPAPQDTATVLVFAAQPLRGPLRPRFEDLPLRSRLLRSDTARVLITFVPRGETPAPIPSVLITFRHLEQHP